MLSLLMLARPTKVSSKWLTTQLCPAPHLCELPPTIVSLTTVWGRLWASLVRVRVKSSSRWKAWWWPSSLNSQDFSYSPALSIESNNSSFLRRVHFSLCSPVWKFDVHKFPTGFSSKRYCPQSMRVPPTKDSNRINVSATNEASIERLRALRASPGLLSWCKRSECHARTFEAPVKRSMPSNMCLLHRRSKRVEAKVLLLFRVVDLLLFFLKRFVKGFLM